MTETAELKLLVSRLMFQIENLETRISDLETELYEKPPEPPEEDGLVFTNPSPLYPLTGVTKSGGVVGMSGWICSTGYINTT